MGHCAVGKNRNFQTSDLATGFLPQRPQDAPEVSNILGHPLVTGTHLPLHFGWSCSSNSREIFSEFVKCITSRKKIQTNKNPGVNTDIFLDLQQVIIPV